MGCHFPGAIPGLLDDDTGGVSNLPRSVLVTAGRRAQGTGHRAQSTGYRAQGTEHRAQGTGHRAQGTGHRAQGEEAKRRLRDEETARPQGRRDCTTARPQGRRDCKTARPQDRTTTRPQDRGKPHEFLSINDILLIVIRQIFYLKRYYFLSSCDCAVCASRAGSFIFYKLPRRFSA